MIEFAAEKAVAAAKIILPVEGNNLMYKMHCITKRSRNHLLSLAGADRKNTTIVGYVKYLLKSGTVTEDFLFFRLQNASALEMSQRLTAETRRICLRQSTFHKLWAGYY